MLAAMPRKQYRRLLTGLEAVVLTFGEAAVGSALARKFLCRHHLWLDF
jgi:hypothetical protein